MQWIDLCLEFFLQIRKMGQSLKVLHLYFLSCVYDIYGLGLDRDFSGELLSQSSPADSPHIYK